MPKIVFRKASVLAPGEVHAGASTSHAHDPLPDLSIWGIRRPQSPFDPYEQQEIMRSRMARDIGLAQWYDLQHAAMHRAPERSAADMESVMKRRRPVTFTKLSRDRMDAGRYRPSNQNIANLRIQVPAKTD